MSSTEIKRITFLSQKKSDQWLTPSARKTNSYRTKPKTDEGHDATLDQETNKTFINLSAKTNNDNRVSI